jgi:hypothetical protein
MKNCSNKNCKETNPQPFNCFSKDKNRKDGLATQCRVCRSESKKFYKLNPKIKTNKSKERKIFLSNPKNGEKYCSKEDCEQLNPQSLDNFNKNKKSKDGLRTECKNCQSKYNEKWISIVENKQNRKEYLKLKRQESEFKQYLIEYKKTYFLNPENERKRKEYFKKYYEDKCKNNPEYIEKISEYGRIRYSDPTIKSKAAERQKLYALTPEGRAKNNALAAKRRAIKKQATPSWLNEKQFKEIDDIYLKCITITIETGIRHDVDHIVPLQGKTVCGLHVPWNLRIITEKDNQIKHNKLIVDLFS